MGAWEAILRDIDNRFEDFCLYAAVSTVRMQAKSNQINYFSTGKVLLAPVTQGAV